MISTQDQETNKRWHKSKIKTTKIIKIQNVKITKEKRREEERNTQPILRLNRHANPGWNACKYLLQLSTLSNLIYTNLYPN